MHLENMLHTYMKLLILIPVRANLLYPFQCETHCIQFPLLFRLHLILFCKKIFCDYQETASMMVLKDKLLACNKYKAMMWPNLKIKESSPSLQAHSSN